MAGTITRETQKKREGQNAQPAGTQKRERASPSRGKKASHPRPL
jgi:hypothetical protein